MKNSEFIKQLRLRYRWIIFFASAAFIASIFIYFRFNNRYKGEVTIMIPLSNGQNEKGASEAERYVLAIQSNVVASRLTNFIFSDMMIKHMNQKFNLYKHYNIDKYNKYSWNVLVNSFQDNIKIERQDDEMAKIIFYDADEVVAADIANEIVTKLILMNKEYVINSVTQKRDLYANLVGELNTQVGGQISQLQAVMSDFKAQSNLSERNFDKLDLNFNNAVNDISRLTTDLVRMQQFYKWSQVAIEDNFQDNVLVINNAFPYKPPVNYLKMFSIGFFGAVLMISLVCTLIYLYFYTKIQWRLMLNEP